MIQATNDDGGEPGYQGLGGAHYSLSTGLAILTRVADLDDYFRHQVISGPAAFSIKAADYDDFSRAFRIKLRRELAPAISRLQDQPSGAGLALRPR